jgi:malonyl-CoA O-methyltransferase
MSLDTPAHSAPRPVDAVALARLQQRLLRAAEPPWLHGEVARRMAERLTVIRLQPAQVVDWGSFLGASQAHLAQAYPQARMVAVEQDSSRGRATAAQLRQRWWKLWKAAVEVVTPDQLAPGQAQLLWSNMSLQGVLDPAETMRAWQQALAVDGFLMFSTLGPGSLRQLAALYAREAWPAAHAPFVDMHDLGDMLVAAGFADPVMDQETITLTWASPQALLDELRTMGGNVAPHRQTGLRTPRWRDQLLAGLADTADAGGRVAMDFEVVYGHAFKPLPRPRVTGRTEVPLADMQVMVRSSRKG